MPGTERRGLLFAFEGIDGSGKSTAMARLAERLRSEGADVTVSAEPTKRRYGAALKKAWAEGRRLPVKEELDLFEMDRREHADIVIRPALERGRVVLLDRYYYSSAAYQGVRGGPSPEEILRRMEAFAPRPNIAFLFEVTIEVALHRIASTRPAADVLEHPENLQAVAASYAIINRPEIRRIDASRTPAEIDAELWRIVEPLI